MDKLFQPGTNYLPLVFAALRAILILASGFLLSMLLKRLLRTLKTSAVRLMIHRGQVYGIELEKRANTIVSVIQKPALILLWIAVILFALREPFGESIQPILAGAGVSAGILGVAVGFGAQTLIKDVLAGVFMLIENQIRVNDVAVINGTGGLVEEINLRTTVLRAENGAVHIFPNGSIQTLANLTREFAYYVLELSVAFEQDTDEVIAVLREITDELRADPAYRELILEPLDVLGVDRFSTAGLVVKARVKTLPQRQWSVGRELNRRIRIRFAADRINQPVQKSIVRLEGSPLVPGGRDELKALVREVLAETGGR